MRDVERLREKREFSLDDRQVWALGLCALLLLGGVFALGLMVGRRLPPPAAPATDLAALDAAEKPAAPAHAPPPAAPAPKVAEAAPTPAAAGDKPADKPAQGRSPAHAAAEPQHVAVVAPPPRTPVVVQPAPQRPAQVAAAAPAALTAPPRDLGEFTVQIGASQDRSEAQRMENKVRAAGMKPYVVEANLGARGTWYRVRVGAFRDKDTANRFRRDVERELRLSAVVMPSRQGGP